MRHLKIIVTAGPTREHIDDVRFISNASSGRMGVAVARAALDRGHQVVLIAGPMEIPAPDGADTIPVTNAQEMCDAVLQHIDSAEALVMTAAVSDWRPAERFEGKKDKGPEEFSLKLVRNPDILREATNKSPNTIAVAFALEAEMDVESALRKMKDKGAEFVVLNTIKAMGADEAECAVYAGPGEPLLSGKYSKRALAEAILNLVEREKSR